MCEFVNFSIAKKLKEKGFREKCVAYYWEKINEHTPAFVVEDCMPEDGICLLDLLSNHNQVEWSCFIDAPTISQVLTWLRKEKKIHITIDLLPSGYYAMIYIGISDENNSFNWRDFYDDLNIYETYELAAIAGVEYCLDNLI